METSPWWWLDDTERARLGLGAYVARSAHGVVFGDTDRPFRLELLPRTDEAPVRLGPIAMRVWGSSSAPEARRLLRAAVDILGPRLAEGFDPDAISWDAPPTAAAPSPATRTTIID